MALTHLMSQYGLGGGRWVRQFVFGFDVMGRFPQQFLFPVGRSAKPPMGPDTPLVDSAERFATMALCSGFAHMDNLWSGALSHVECGWLTDPIPLDAAGGMLTVPDGHSNVTFRFAVIQMDKIRAFGDFKYGRVKLACAARTPIRLPTCDYIGQLFLDVLQPDGEWEFFKAVHQAAYKNISL